MTDNCPICKNSTATTWLSSNNILICQCSDCKIGFVEDRSVRYEYESYGKYITEFDDNYFSERKNIGTVKKLFFFILKKLKGKNIKILDFGGGAGFFASSCIKSGFTDTYIVEPSKEFRDAAVERVGLPFDKVFETIDKVPINIKFDFVIMLDVIEHLPLEEMDEIMATLRCRLNEQGLLLVATPNMKSLNIKLHKEKDPVVAPPSHTLYFSCKSLRKFLAKHCFSPIFLTTMGMSHNSFFRNSKFKPSWVEIPVGIHQKVISRLIRIVFSLFSLALTPLGMGYHINGLFRYSDDLKKTEG